MRLLPVIAAAVLLTTATKTFAATPGQDVEVKHLAKISEIFKRTRVLSDEVKELNIMAVTASGGLPKRGDPLEQCFAFADDRIRDIYDSYEANSILLGLSSTMETENDRAMVLEEWVPRAEGDVKSFRQREGLSDELEMKICARHVVVVRVLKQMTNLRSELASAYEAALKDLKPVVPTKDNWNKPWP